MYEQASNTMKWHCHLHATKYNAQLASVKELPACLLILPRDLTRLALSEPAHVAALATHFESTPNVNDFGHARESPGQAKCKPTSVS